MNGIGIEYNFSFCLHLKVLVYVSYKATVNEKHSLVNYPYSISRYFVKSSFS